MQLSHLLCHSSEKSTPLQTYIDYIGLKAHFNGDMIWKPSFKGNLTDRNLIERQDAYIFKKISNKYGRRSDILNLFISALQNRPDFHVSDFQDDDLLRLHKDRIRRCFDMEKTLEGEVDNLERYMKENDLTIKNILSRKEKPLLVKRSKTIGAGTPEMMGILDSYFNFCIGDTSDPLWNQRAKSFKHYGKLFTNTDRIEFRSLIDRLV